MGGGEVPLLGPEMTPHLAQLVSGKGERDAASFVRLCRPYIGWGLVN